MLDSNIDADVQDARCWVVAEVATSVVPGVDAVAVAVTAVDVVGGGVVRAVVVTVVLDVGFAFTPVAFVFLHPEPSCLSHACQNGVESNILQIYSYCWNDFVTNNRA